MDSDQWQKNNKKKMEMKINKHWAKLENEFLKSFPPSSGGGCIARAR